MSESLENLKITEANLRREIKELKSDMECHMKDIQFLLKEIDHNLEINNKDLETEIKSVVSSEIFDTQLSLKNSIKDSVGYLNRHITLGFGVVAVILLAISAHIR